MQSYFLKMKNFLERDWLEDIKNFYLNINPVYRHSFWILFIITNIVFGFHTINFLWADHDWLILVNGAPLSHSLWEGRYSAFVMSELLTGNLYLPIISALWAFVALSLSAILLAIYWKLPKKTSYFVIFGLILNITPYTCAWLYFGHWIVNIFFARMFIIIGLILSNKIVEMQTIKQKIRATILAILLMNFGFSVNPSFLNTFIIALSGRILIEMLEWISIKEGIKKSFKQNIYTVFNIGGAIIIFKIVFMYLKSKKIIPTGRYNLESTPLSEIPDKAVQCIKAAWEQFTNFAIPFYPDILTKLFFILAMIFVVQIIFSKRSRLIKLLIFITFIITLFLTKVVAIIGKGDYPIFLTRVDFCGYVLFNALIIAANLKLGGVLHNIKIFTCILIIYLFITNDYHQQRTFKLAFDTEVMVYNRMYARLERSDNFIKGKKYMVVQIGNYITGSTKFIKQKKYSYMGDTLLPTTFNTGWQAFTLPSFYNSSYVKQAFKNNSFTNLEFMSALRRLNDAGLLENAKAWPAENSIIVYEDIILVITDEKDLQKAKQLLEEQDKKEQALKDRIKAKAKPVATSELQAETK